MPTIYPSSIEPRAPRSERDVFECLRDGLPGDWVVMHGKRFVLPAEGRRRPEEGEADFLILDPRRGFICLEVKGGQEVGRDGDGWYSVPYGSTRREQIKDPGRQAQGAAHTLGQLLRQHRSLRQISYGWAVCFPGTEVPGALGMELPRELIVDRADLSSIERELNRVFQQGGVNGPPLDAQACKAFVDTLAPCFQLARSLEPLVRPSRPLGERIDLEERELVRLTEEQMLVLDWVPEVSRVAVAGAAGTGKTLVAMEKARRLATAGARVLFLCYNRELARKLATEANGFTVTTFHSLCREQSRAAGIPFTAGDDASQSFWEEEAPDKLIEALDVYPDERWDAVVVDEAQDFQELWWIAIEKLLADPEQGPLWAFYDPQQNIFGGGPDNALEVAPHQLTYNCRNTQKIATQACQYVDIEPKVRPHAPEGVDVEVVSCRNDDEMTEAVRKALHSLVVEQKIPARSVLVLSPRSEANSVVWRKSRFGNFQLVKFPTAPGNNEVSFSTLQRFKGLEADAVILCEAEPRAPNSTPRHLYVGASRAKHALVIAQYAAD